eukprot:TRINITY_DN91027_c0_g1_i1.p1 TRINITY_DN91027_c0_g1~~TRINITY_DN91027_c0_g1_i1.p1  ORF type:complete len:284 (-),score=31.31 TRINITY_DN91027_c0_g1_i1:197-1048(-)
MSIELVKTSFRNASFAPHKIQCTERACKDFVEVSAIASQVLESHASSCSSRIQAAVSIERLPGMAQDDIDPWADYNPDKDDYDVRTTPLLPAATLTDETTRKQISALKGRIRNGGDCCVISHYLKVVGQLEASISRQGICSAKLEIPAWRKLGHARTPSSRSVASESTCCPQDDQGVHFGLEDDIIPRARPHNDTESQPAEDWKACNTYKQGQQAVSPEPITQPTMKSSRVLTSQMLTRHEYSPGEEVVQPAWFTMAFPQPVQIHNDQAARSITTDLRWSSCS